MQKMKDYDSTPVVFLVTGGDSLLCGYLSNEEVYDYLKKLTKQDLDKEHCAKYEFSLNGYPYCKPCTQKLRISACLQIDGRVCSLNPLCGVRSVGGCFRKLENIGKVFWSDKYGKQK